MKFLPSAAIFFRPGASGRPLQAVAGERDAQRQLYEQLAGPMFGLVRRVVRDRATAEGKMRSSCAAQTSNTSSPRN